MRIITPIDSIIKMISICTYHTFVECRCGRLRVVQNLVECLDTTETLKHLLPSCAVVPVSVQTHEQLRQRVKFLKFIKLEPLKYFLSLKHIYISSK